MRLKEFALLNEEEAIRYDFFNESIIADNSRLIKEIYTALFPWYKDEQARYSGNVMNT